MLVVFYLALLIPITPTFGYYKGVNDFAFFWHMKAKWNQPTILSGLTKAAVWNGDVFYLKARIPVSPKQYLVYSNGHGT